MANYMQRKKPFYAEKQYRNWLENTLKEIRDEQEFIMESGTITVEEETVE